MLRALGRGVLKATREVSNVSFGGAFAILCFVTILVNVDILLRYFFGAPILWATEISEAALLYITFLGTERVLRGDAHVKVDVLISRIRGRKRMALDLVSSCIGLVVSATLTIFGALVTWHLQPICHRVTPCAYYSRYTLWLLAAFGRVLHKDRKQLQGINTQR